MSGNVVSPFRQPKAVFAVAFACVVSFMGIGLVDPILPAISHQLNASPSEVTLLFTSYLVVTAVAMLITNWVSSRIGAKRTLIVGLILIVAFSAAAGASPSISAIIGFRAGWGVGNALFIATSLAVIVASASGGFTGAIVLYETALGLGIAVGPLLGGTLGEISWRGPFFGVAALMSIALIATVVLVQPVPLPAKKTSLADPLKALRHRGLLTMSLTALCYNWGFFTVLGYAPFPMNLSPIKLGLVFTGWGVMVAIFAVFGAPRLQARFGIARTMYANLAAFAVVILCIAIWTTDRTVLIVAVIVSGVFIGVNNTVTTQAVMTISPVDRPVASAAYSFVRFIGGGLAPYAAGRLVIALNIHVPFFIAAGAVVVGIVILTTIRKELAAAERVQAEQVIAPATASVPAITAAERIVAVPHAAAAGLAAGQPEYVIVAAVDDSPVAGMVTEAAGRLAAERGRAVHLVHAQEAPVAGDAGLDGEDLADARALVTRHLDQLARHRVPAQGQILLHAADHGAAGRMLAEYATAVGAITIVIGAPSHGGLAAAMDASTSSELLRHTQSNVLIVNPAAPLPAVTSLPETALPATALPATALPATALPAAALPAAPAAEAAQPRSSEAAATL
jgi:ACDE family multidrug resistance protein